mgnify:CR=1 FL=1
MAKKRGAAKKTRLAKRRKHGRHHVRIPPSHSLSLSLHSIAKKYHNQPTETLKSVVTVEKGEEKSRQGAPLEGYEEEEKKSHEC